LQYKLLAFFITGVELDRSYQSLDQQAYSAHRAIKPTALMAIETSETAEPTTLPMASAASNQNPGLSPSMA